MLTQIRKVPRKLAWFCNSHAIGRSCRGFNLCSGALTLNYVGTRMELVMCRIDCDSGGLMERTQDCPMVSFGIDWCWALVLWNQAVRGFHSGVIKGCSLLGHHTALLDKLFLMFRWTNNSECQENVPSDSVSSQKTGSPKCWLIILYYQAKLCADRSV